MIEFLPTRRLSNAGTRREYQQALKPTTCVHSGSRHHRGIRRSAALTTAQRAAHEHHQAEACDSLPYRNEARWLNLPRCSRYCALCARPTGSMAGIQFPLSRNRGVAERRMRVRHRCKAKRRGLVHHPSRARQWPRGNAEMHTSRDRTAVSVISSALSRQAQRRASHTRTRAWGRKVTPSSHRSLTSITASSCRTGKRESTTTSCTAVRCGG